MDPLGARAHSLLAANLMVQHDYDLALVHANESLRLDPKSADGLAVMVGLCSAGARLAEARTYYEKALAMVPKHRHALFGLARLLSTVEDPKQNAGSSRSAKTLGGTSNRLRPKRGIYARSMCKVTVVATMQRHNAALPARPCERLLPMVSQSI